MKKLKIGFFGDGIWAENSIALLLNNSDISIRFICIRYNTNNAVLRAYAKNLGIECFCHENVNSEEFQKKISHINCDLYVSMSFDQIFKKRILSLPSLGIINCHAGNLPFYRGRNILNWVLINDEKEFGITVHFVDEGIDTGDIIVQEKFPINDHDTYKTLLELAYENCPLLLLKALKLFKKDKPRTIKQKTISEFGMYCSKRLEGDEVINWNSTSREIFNFIRALTYPGPCARSFIGGIEIKLIASEEINGAKNYIDFPGAILEVKESYFIVKTLDTYIKIIKWQTGAKLKIGERLS